MKKFTLFLFATLFSALSFAAQPKRIYAYGLSATLEGTMYTFSFSANETPTSGRMLFYDATTSELVGEIALTSPVLGVNNVQISVDELPGIHNQQLNWAVELSAAKVTAYEKIYADASHKYRRGHSNVDVSPESDHFGAVYVGDRVKTTANGKFYVYSPTYAIKDANGYSLGSSAWGFSRFDVAPDGKVWLSDFSDAHSGLWIVDPSDLTAATQFFKGTRTTSGTYAGVIKNDGVDVGSSLSCATLYGRGADTKLITVGEDYKNYSFPVTVFNIGQTDGSLATSWSIAPSKMFSTLGNAAANLEAKACEKGVWVSTNRGTGSNTEGATSLRFYTWDGNCTWSSHEYTDVINGNLGAGFEITPDEKQLIMKVADKTITIFDITWNESTPTLTKKTSFDCGYAAVSSINLDYAGNIVTVAGTAWGNTDDKRMSLVVYSNPTDNNICEVPAKKASVVTKKVLHTLTSFSNDEAKGTVSGAGTYIKGTTATLTATPAAGYKLLYWSDRSTENPRTITMNKNEAISAYFVKVYDQEPTFTITKVWENTNVPAATGDGFQAVGWDGNIYMQNKTAGKIQVFSNGTDAAVDFATSNISGQQIAIDEAGNMIVFNAYFATATPSAIQIFKNGSTTAKAITFTLPNPGRCDFISASGDIYSAEGGYVYFYCKDQTAVNRVKITNGAATAADISVNALGNTTYAASSVSHVMVDIFGNLAAHNRSTAVYAINSHTGETKSFGASLSGIKLSTLGGCSFELGGKELWAYNAGTTNYSSEWNIYNLTNKKLLSDEVLYAVDKNNSTNNSCNWLNVQVVNEYTAYIYQFCPKKAVALWKVTMQAGKATYTVTANATNGSVTGAGTYEEGATATLTATPAEHYRFVNWTEGENVISTEATYTFTVTEDITITANFESIPQYAITVSANDGEMGSVTGGGNYYEGSTATLTATPVGGYVFEKWDDDNTDNPRTITVNETNAAATYTAIFKLAPARVFAYNLDIVDNGNDTYTFSFIPNTNALSGRLIIYNGDTKAQIHEEAISGTIAKGVKSEVTIIRSLLPEQGSVTWAVELTGEPVEKVTLLTKANDKANYGFNRPQGVAIDNNPASDFFGRMYIALPKAGGSGYSDTNYGIVVMDPVHNRLKSGVIANGDALGNNGRYSMHRVTVNPTNGHVYYVRTADNSEGVTGTAIYELTPSKDNILSDGGTAKNVISGASDITNANSVCFDETGAMYVMANANYTNAEGSTGRVYKVVDGEATLFTPNSIELASKDNAIVSDGKGGFWAAQHRNSLDAFNHLVHITAAGTIDYYIDNSTNASLLPIQTFTSGGTTYKNASYRGQVAYYSIDENSGLVAYGGGAKVSIFKASYNGSGVPTLTAWKTISLVTQSTTAAVNVDGIAFDYAGNIVILSATDERMYQYALPLESENTSLVPSPTSKTIKLGTLYNVEVAVNDNAMGTATGAGEFLAGETATVTATANDGYRFANWHNGTEVVSTDKTYTFSVTGHITLTANFEPLPEIAYELNGGQWNKYGWTSKKDMYNALLDDWRAYSGSGRTNVTYEEQLGVGNSSKGIPTTVSSADDRVALWNLFTDPTYASKWGWLATYVDAVAATQYNKMVAANGVKTQPTSAAGVFTFTIGNFFGEDNAHSTDYIDAVDFTGAEAQPQAFQPTWGQSLPNPTQPTTTVVLGTPYKENYLFEGWYAEEDFSGTPVTTVDQNTGGTLYAKWVAHFYTHNPNNKYGTICLPYASASTTGAYFYEVAGKEEGKVYLASVDVLEAGVPYIFEKTASTITVFYAGEAVDAPQNGDANGLVGTFEEIEVPDGDYILYNDAFRTNETGGTLNKIRANRAYLNMDVVTGSKPTPMPGRRYIGMDVEGENEATGFDNIQLPNANSQKLIINGQLIIIRDGEMYNAQGMLIE